jgi:hypothetical protein
MSRKNVTHLRDELRTFFPNWAATACGHFVAPERTTLDGEITCGRCQASRLYRHGDPTRP